MFRTMANAEGSFGPPVGELGFVVEDGLFRSDFPYKLMLSRTRTPRM